MRSKKKKLFSRYLISLIVILIAVYSLIFIITFHKKLPEKTKIIPTKQQRKKTSIKEKIIPSKPEIPLKPDKLQEKIERIKAVSKLFLIIDDFGWYSKMTEKYLNLPINFTIAIIPEGPQSARIYSTALNKKNISVLIHQPMEAKEYHNNEKNLLRISMSANEIESILAESFKKFPSAVGINNHTGSLFTENYDKMKIVFNWTKKNNLIFIDSMTTPKTVSRLLSKELNFSLLENSFFLDNLDDTFYIENRLKLLEQKLISKHELIAIGHVQTEPLYNLLIKYIELFKEKNILFERISR